MSSVQGLPLWAFALWGLAGCPEPPPPVGDGGSSGTSTEASSTTSSSTRDASAAADSTAAEDTAATTLSTGGSSENDSNGETLAPTSETASDAESGATGSTEGGVLPPTLPADPRLWFAADHGVEADAEGRVSALLDRSEQRHRAEQSEAARMPRLVDVAGLPMLFFDGNDDALRLPTGFDTWSGVSFYAVVEAFHNVGCAGILSFSNGDDDDDIEFGRHTLNLLYYEVLGEFVEGATDAFEVDRRFLISVVQASSGAAELRLDRTLTGSGTILLPAAGARSQNYLGRNTYDECPTSFHGHIGEVLLYPRALTPTEQVQVETYLAERWDLVLPD